MGQRVLAGVVVSGLLAAGCEVTAARLPVVLVTAAPRQAQVVPDVCPSGLSSPCSFGDLAPTASATPAPVASAPAPSLHETGGPLDVAIAGPGYFVLAPREAPFELTSLYFTRHGAFRWTYHEAAPDAPNARPQYRLESAEGLPVLGYALAPDRRVPLEGAGASFTSAFGLDGGALEATPVVLDALANPGREPRIDYSGRLRFGGTGDAGVSGPEAGEQEAVDAEGRPLAWHLALALGEDPNALVPVPGTGWRRYERAGGRLDVGFAGTPAAHGDLPRPVGDAATLRPGWLED